MEIHFRVKRKLSQRLKHILQRSPKLNCYNHVDSQGSATQMTLSQGWVPIHSWVQPFHMAGLPLHKDKTQTTRKAKSPSLMRESLLLSDPKPGRVRKYTAEITPQ